MNDENVPATKADIGLLKTDIGLLRSEVNHGYRELSERMDDGFTRLLNAFYGVAETNGKRLGELDSNEHAIRSRLSTVEGRVMELEKRINMPPAA